ncbi:MAG: MFS transporter [Actinomycetota bacterium]|nr:MFS transporter [Actinomycetota bacterium]
MFRSIKERNYRLFLVGHAVSVVGTWMQRVAQDWLVLQLTDSAVAVGVATALQFLPILLLGAWGGVVVDRLDTRRAILATQAASAFLAACLAGVTLAGVVQLSMVYALALALGFVTVVDVPARQSFVTEMVDQKDWVNAHALNSTIHNAGRLLGPAVAGAVIATGGTGVAFALNAVSFAAVLGGLIAMDPAQLRPRPTVPRKRGQVREGLRYAWGRPEIRSSLLLVAVVALFGQNFRVVLPLLARDDFSGGAQTYGLLTSALGLGAVLGALATATRATATFRALLAWTAVFGVVNFVAAVAPSLPVALAVLVALGVANIAFNTLARSLLQLNTAAQMQGRVIALHGLLFLGSTPFGGPLTGWICEQWGARSGFVVAGVTALAAAVALVPRLMHTATPMGEERQPQDVESTPPSALTRNGDG